MLAFAFILISFAGQIDVSTSVAKGFENKIPIEFTDVTELNHLEIRSSYWAKVEINGQVEGNYILQGGKASLKKIRFYDEEKNLIGTGNNVKIRLKAESLTYYLYYPFVDEKDGDLLSIRVVEEIQFLKARFIERTFQLAFHSFLAFPLLIALVLALRTRSSVYIYYALYILAIMSFFGYQYGLLGEILPVFNDIPPMWIWFFSFLNATFYLLFSSSFLDLKRFDPFSGKLILVANWFIFIFFLISITIYLIGIDVQHSIGFKVPFLVIEVCLIIWFIARTLKHPSRIKKYYLVGFFILIIEGIVGQVLSINQNAANYNHLFQLGMVVEVFILALGLSVRIDETQKEKNKAQNDLINQLKVNEELQAKYTDELEYKVRVRTEALSKRNEENEVLLKEVHHRVKNNLQMITSMLSMRERRTESEDLSSQLASTKNKIKSIALIHEHLYMTSDFSNIHLPEYVSRLCEMIIDSLHKGAAVDLQLSVENISADIETAIPLGIMINELVTNSLKYGLSTKKKPILGLKLSATNESLDLLIYDNGDGFSPEHKEGLGLTIIRSILENMNGTISYLANSEMFEIKISMLEYKVEKNTIQTQRHLRQ